MAAKSPVTTGMRSPPGFARSLATMASDESIPCTSRPRSTMGSARRPVPMPSSRTGPGPATWARNSTAGPVSARAASHSS